MGNSSLKESVKGLYPKILNNKLITICVLFTVFTLIDTISIILGLWPAKVGIGPYVHLLGRFILMSILMVGLFIYDTFRKKVKSQLLIYVLTFFVTWGILLAYVWSNSLFTELHPDAFIDVSRSYGSMYLLLGIVILIAEKIKSSI